MQSTLKLIALLVLFFSWGRTEAKSGFTSDSLQVSLLTASPGEQVYERFGHTALRVKDLKGNTDLIFNYGLFSFNTPNFIYRFVKGETDYQLGVTEMRYFLGEYAMRGSRVTEQVLRLSPEQARSVFDALMENYLPQNRVYRYNFFYDNCSTRPRDIIEQHIGARIDYYDPGARTTYRELVHQKTAMDPWLVFGIDLALGEKADRVIDYRQEMFLPEILLEAFETATVEKPMDEKPLVENTMAETQGKQPLVEDTKEKPLDEKPLVEDTLAGSQGKQPLVENTKEKPLDEKPLVEDTLAGSQGKQPLVENAMVGTQGKQPLVKETVVLIEEDPETDRTAPLNPLTSPLFVCWALFAGVALICVREYRKNKICRPLDTLLFGIAGIAGCILFFLNFISTHPTVDNNLNCIWLQPLHLFAAVAVWVKSLKRVLYYYHFANFVALILLLAFYGLIPQQFNAAFFPLIGVLLLRSGIHIILRLKKSN